jgi:hypothetical protein
MNPLANQGQETTAPDQEGPACSPASWPVLLRLTHADAGEMP